MATPNERAAELTLRFQLVRADVQKALQGTGQLERGIANLSNEAGGSVRDLRRAADATDELGAAAARSEDKIQRETRQLREKAAAIRENARAALENRQAQQSATGRSGREAAGDISTAFGAFGAVAGSGATSEALRGLGDLFGALEQTPRFTAGLSDLKGILAADQIAVLGLNTSLGTLSLVALPVAAALAGVVLALKKYNEGLQTQKDRLEVALEGVQAYYDAIAEGTTESITAQIEDAQANLDALNRQREDLRAQIDAQKLETAFGREGTRFGAGPAVKILEDRLAELDSQAQENEDSITNLTNALDSSEVAARDAAAAQNALTESRLAGIQREAAIQDRVSQLEGGSSDQVKARIQAIEDEKQSIEDQLAAMEALDQTNQDVIDRTAELHQSYRDLEQEENTLRDETYGLVKAREREQQAIEYQQKQMEDTAAAVKKYNEDETRIKERGIQDRMRLDERYADTQVRIAQAAADAAEAALERLQERRSDLELELRREGIQAGVEAERDRLDLQIDLQREEAREAREHADRMLDIQRRAHQEEVELAFKRDFAGISRLKRQTGQELSEENLQAARRRRERLIDFEQEREDQLTQYAREREDRLTKFQQDLEDAEDQYRRELRLLEEKRRKELQLAAQAYNADLQLLSQKLSAELQARRQAIQAELQLINLGYAERARLEAQWQQRLVAQAGAILGSAASYSTYQTQNSMTLNQNITGGMSAEQVASISISEFKHLYNRLFT